MQGRMPALRWGILGFGDGGRKGGDADVNAGIATGGGVSRFTGIAWYSVGPKRPSQA
jgi:hypothetical protein